MRKTSQSRNVTLTKSEGVNSFLTKLGSIVCSLTMVVSMCPMVATTAYADEATPTDTLAEDVVFTVYTQSAGGDKQVAKEYTQSEWNDLTAQAEGSETYVYSKGGTVKAKAATEYVTLDDLIADAGASDYWTEGSTVSVSCSDGDYSKGPWANMTYDLAHQAYKAFPNATATDYNVTGAVDAPIILTNAYGTVDVTSTYEAAREDALAASYQGIGALVGQTTEDFSTNGPGAGNRFPNSVVSITVTAPAFSVYYTVDGGEPQLAKAYSQSEWNELTAQTEGSEAYAYAKGSGVKVKSATAYATLDDVIADAGISEYWVEDCSTVSLSCYDGPYSKGVWANMTYDLAHQAYKAFPNATATDWNIEGETDAPIILTSCYGTADVTSTYAAATADAQAAAYDGIAAFVGQTEEDFVANGPGAGNRFPNGVTSLTVNYTTPKVMSIYVSSNGADPILLKSYTQDEWNELAAQAEATNPVAMTAKGSAKVRVATEYVTLDDLIADAGGSQYWVEGAAVKAYCYDGVYNKGIWAGKGLSYEYAHQNLQSFPNATATTFTDEGALDAPVVLASTYGTAFLGDYANIAEAGKAAEAAAYSDGNIGVVLGQTAESAEGCNWQAGSSFASGVQSLVINYPYDVATVTTEAVACGDIATFTCETSIPNAQYQWQWRKSSTSKWNDCTTASSPDVTSATLEVKAAAYRAGYEYRCCVFSSDGRFAESEGVNFDMKTAVLVTEPTTIGSTATFTCLTNVEGATYQWQWRKSTKSSWKDCTEATSSVLDQPTLTLLASARRANYQYRCIVTGADGMVVKSAGLGFDLA